MKSDLYQQVTDRILAELREGAAPWVKPWSGLSADVLMPANGSTGRAYSGVNVLLLWMAQADAGFASGRWVTFKQALEAGGNVRKGEKGSKVVYVNAIEREEENTAGETKTRRIPFLKQYTVFNLEQCEGLPETMRPAAPDPVNPDTRDQAAETLIKNTGAIIREGSGRAAYAPALDAVEMPAFETFQSADHYYSTMFHELGHWTGHKSRLDRDLRGRFGDDCYAAEELIAELTAAFLAAQHGFDGDLRHAGYLDHWIKVLEADNRAIFTAAAQAQKAADYLRSCQAQQAAA